MNQNDIINAVSESTGFTKADTKRFFEAQADVITTTLKKMRPDDDGVTLPSLGKFKVKKRAARTARNPQTGEEIKVPAKKVPAFSSTKSLKELFAKK